MSKNLKNLKNFKNGFYSQYIPTTKASTEITEDLTNLILCQIQDVSQLNRVKMNTCKKLIKQTRESQYKAELKEIMSDESANTKRVIEAAAEKGSYVWLSALPLKALGYVLNKTEFQDAIALRYNWEIKGTPKH